MTDQPIPTTDQTPSLTEFSSAAAPFQVTPNPTVSSMAETPSLTSSADSPTLTPPSKIATKPPQLLIGVALLAALGLFLLSYGFLKQKPSAADQHPSILMLGKQQPTVEPTPDLSQYDLDTDGDKIPDFVETELGLDPHTNNLLSCYTNNCGDAALQQGQVKKKNILLIVDGSGSMNIQVGGETKMAAAKRAVERFVTTYGAEAQIGLMTYGHKGSNSTADKPASCASAEVLAPLGSVTASSVTTYTSQLKPVGWTPIGLSLQQAATVFVGKENDLNQVIVLTDGAETCNTNPVAAAQALINSPAKVKVSVIGFGITAAEQAGLQKISQAGQGSFATANSSFELDDVFKKQWENYAAVRSELDCKATDNTAGVQCGSKVFKQLSDYHLKNVLPQAGKTSKEKQRLDQMMNDFSAYKTQVMNQKSDEFAARAKEQSQKLWK